MCNTIRPSSFGHRHLFSPVSVYYFILDNKKSSESLTINPDMAMFQKLLKCLSKILAGDWIFVVLF